jgi:hypothetical protein
MMPLPISFVVKPADIVSVYPTLPTTRRVYPKLDKVVTAGEFGSYAEQTNDEM